MALLVASCGYNHQIYIYHGRTYIKNVILGRHMGLPLQVVPFGISHCTSYISHHSPFYHSFVQNRKGQALSLHVVPFYISVEKPWHAMAQPPQPFTINN
ncbi:MAG: hypothetical protein WAT92_19560 [Saprospiraceae bacterium]